MSQESSVTPAQSTIPTTSETSVPSPSASPQSSSPTSLLRGMSYGAQVATLTPPEGPVQRKGKGGDEGDVHAAAAHGISGGGGALPFADKIQRSFGGYDIGHVQAHTDAKAAQGSAAMGADAYATGTHVAFGGAPDLHTAAHEAAHIVQQQAGVQLSGGVGQAGDPYEKHADAVADAVVRGESAEPILAKMAGAPGGGAGGVQQKAVQRKETPPVEKTKEKVVTTTPGTQTPLPTTKPTVGSPALAAHEKDVEDLRVLVQALERAGEKVQAGFETRIVKKLESLKAAIESQASATTSSAPPAPGTGCGSFPTT